jgi:hypothetical protein
MSIKKIIVVTIIALSLSLGYLLYLQYNSAADLTKVQPKSDNFSEFWSIINSKQGTYKDAVKEFEKYDYNSANVEAKLKYIWSLTNQYSSIEEVNSNIPTLSKAFLLGVNIGRDDTLNPEDRAKGYMWAVAIRGASYRNIGVLQDVYKSGLYDKEFSDMFTKLGIKETSPNLDTLSEDQKSAILSMFTGFIADEANKLYPNKFAYTRKMNSLITEADYIEKNKILTGTDLAQRKEELFKEAQAQHDLYVKTVWGSIEQKPVIKIAVFNSQAIGLDRVDSYFKKDKGEVLNMYKEGYLYITSLPTDREGGVSYYNHILYNIILQAYTQYFYSGRDSKVNEAIAISKMKELTSQKDILTNYKYSSFRYFMKNFVLNLDESTSGDNWLPMKTIIRITSEKDTEIKKFFESL